MSELVLNSFQQSTISQTFKKLGNDIPVSGIVPSRAPSTTEILKTPARSTIAISGNDIPQGSQFVVDVPRYGHLAAAVVEFVYKITSKGTLGGNVPFGLVLAQNISLQTANRTLYDQPDLASIGRVTVNSGPGKASWLMSLAEKITTSNFLPDYDEAEAESVSYNAIHAPFFEDERNYYDASRNESLRVVVSMNSKAGAGLPTDLTFTTASVVACNLYTWHVKYDSETEKMLVEANRKPSIPLQMLGYSHFMESTLCNSTTEPTIIMNSDVPVVRTYVRVKYVGSTDAVLAQRVGKSMPFLYYRIKMNGQEYQQKIPKIIGQTWGMMKGQSGNLSVSSGTSATTFSVTRLSDEVLCINWAHDVMDHTYASGYLPLVALNRPEITLIGDGFSTSVHNIEYCHEYLLMYSQDSSNGQVMIYTSS